MEYLAAILALWTQDKPSYEGRFVSFSGIQSQPRPVQKPHPPIVIGGHSPPAFRRAVEHANGWFGFMLDLEKTAKAIEGLREAEKKYGRPAALGLLEISVTPRGKLDLDTVKRFADLGVERLIVHRPRPTADEMLADVREISATLVGKA